MERLQKVFYSFIMVLVGGGLLYWLGSPKYSADRLALYFLFALVAFFFFTQTYLLIYDVFHRRVTAKEIYLLIYDVWNGGVTATPNTAEKTIAVTDKSDVQKVEKNKTPRWKAVFYSLIILLVLGDLLFLFRGADLRDTFLLYIFAALAALVFFTQTYLLIYDVWHRGVTAALKTIDETGSVTEKTAVQKVEKNKTPRWKAVSSLFITTLALGSLTYWYGAPRSSHDELPLYFFGGFALVALAFFHQTYLLVYDVFHRGVIAALNTADETAVVTEKSDVRKVEGNKMPTRQDGVVNL